MLRRTHIACAVAQAPAAGRPGAERPDTDRCRRHRTRSGGRP